MGNTESFYRCSSVPAQQKAVLHGWYFHDRESAQRLEQELKLQSLPDKNADWNLAIVRSGALPANCDLVCIGPTGSYGLQCIFGVNSTKTDLSAKLTRVWSEFGLPWFERKDDWARAAAPEWAVKQVVGPTTGEQKKNWAESLYLNWELSIPGVYDEKIRSAEHQLKIKTMKEHCEFCRKDVWKKMLGDETTSILSHCGVCYRNCCGMHLVEHVDGSKGYRCPACHTVHHKKHVERKNSLCCDRPGCEVDHDTRTTIPESDENL